MKKVFFIFAIALLALVGCSKEGGADKLILQNTQWIVENTPGNINPPQDLYSVVYVLDFDLAVEGKATTALVITSTNTPQFPVGTTKLIDIDDYYIYTDENGNPYAVKLADDILKIDVIDRNTLKLTSEAASEPITLLRVGKPYELKWNIASFANAQWLSEEGYIYDFDLRKKGYVVGAAKGEDNEYYEVETAKYSELHEVDYSIVTFEAMDGSALTKWKIEKSGDDKLNVYMDKDGLFDVDPVEFVRLTEPVTIYTKVE